MRKLVLIIGIMATAIGCIPLVIDFPNDPFASGPTNRWELLIYLTYDVWYLKSGILLVDR